MSLPFIVKREQPYAPDGPWPASPRLATKVVVTISEAQFISLLMLWTAPHTGIDSCQIPVSVAKLRESAYGTKPTFAGYRV